MSPWFSPTNETNLQEKEKILFRRKFSFGFYFGRFSSSLQIIQNARKQEPRNAFIYDMKIFQICGFQIIIII
jgi:hypothetical protein